MKIFEFGKKIAAAALALTMALSIAACGAKKVTTEEYDASINELMNGFMTQATELATSMQDASMDEDQMMQKSLEVMDGLKKVASDVAALEAPDAYKEAQEMFKSSSEQIGTAVDAIRAAVESEDDGKIMEAQASLMTALTAFQDAGVKYAELSTAAAK